MKNSQFNDLDSLLQKIDNEIDWNQNHKEKLNEELRARIEQKQFDLKKKKGSLKKPAYYVAMAATIFVLFIGSGFVSPAMANVISKIPVINLIFKNNDLISQIDSELQEKHYNIGNISITYIPEKTINIPIIGTDNDYDSIKVDVRNTVKAILQSQNYDSYDIKLSKAISAEKLEEESIEEQEKERAFFMDMYEALDEKKYKVLGIQVTAKKEIIADIPNTEDHIEEIKKTLSEVAAEHGKEGYSVKYYKINLEERAQAIRWQPLLQSINEELIGRKDYQVKSVGYSNHNKPMTLYIETSLNASDPGTKKLSKQIENMVHEFLKSEESKAIIKEEPYKLKIISKNGKEL